MRWCVVNWSKGRRGEDEVLGLGREGWMDGTKQRKRGMAKTDIRRDG